MVLNTGAAFEGQVTAFDTCQYTARMCRPYTVPVLRTGQGVRSRVPSGATMPLRWNDAPDASSIGFFCPLREQSSPSLSFGGLDWRTRNPSLLIRRSRVRDPPGSLPNQKAGGQRPEAKFKPGSEDQDPKT